jgi:hypothetical protein
VALVRTNFSEEHIASIFRVIGLQVFLARNEDVPHGGRGRDSTVTDIAVEVP